MSTVSFYDNYVPPVKDAQYTITVTQDLTVDVNQTNADKGNPDVTSPPQPPLAQTVILRGPRFAVDPDPVGNPRSVVRTGALAQTQSYEYDDMDRLTSVCFQAGTCPERAIPSSAGRTTAWAIARRRRAPVRRRPTNTTQGTS